MWIPELRLQISHILRPISIPSPIEGTLETGNLPTGEDALEDEDGSGPEEVDDGFCALQGEEFDQELAERIMMQDEFGGDEGHGDNWIQDVVDE